MKFILIILLACPLSWAQDNATLMKEINKLKARVDELEKKDSGKGFRSTDYSSKTTESTSSSSSSPETPTMTEEQRKEIMATVEKYKKSQAEQEKALKELEDEE